MWSILARNFLRNRFAYLSVLFIITCVFGFFATKIQLSYDFVKILPEDDKAEIAYNDFKKVFGEDGNVMVIGYKSDDLFKLKTFNEWQRLADSVKTVGGIQNVLSIDKILGLKKNDSLQKLDYFPLINGTLKTQEELDSVKKQILSYPFYKGIVYNDSLNCTLMAVTFNKKDLNSKNRLDIVKQIRTMGDEFAKNNNVEIHYSGLPYIRSEYMRNVSGELGLFMGLAFLVTIITLWIFFRSFNAVFWSLIVCVIGVIWSLGTMYLFGYKITILTGLIPPLIIIIGIPNCIFLINKYQEELRVHGSKIRGLTRTIEKVGMSNFLANVTTSIGFFVFYFTNSELLVQFGIVAGVNVLLTNAVALIFIPIIFSYLKVPSLKQTKHLDGKNINKLLDKIDYWVHNKRRAIYLSIAGVTIISFVGMWMVKPIGFVVDDLPKKDPVYTHLKFFEANFNGVLPFEFSIDTKKENGVFADNAKTLYKIKALEKMIGEYGDIFTSPLSVVRLVKFAYQAEKDGKPKFFILPGSTELKKLSDYSTSVEGSNDKFKAFLDSTKQKTRVSFQMKDVGSVKMKQLLSEIKPKVDSIFDPKEYTVDITGHSVRFLKGNDYLFHHLFVSLGIEVFLILLIGIVLFRSVAIIVLSKLPCLIPLVITAGIMGFMDIYIKPTTILVFSIAFGIASDGTIYILAEYRNQLKKKLAGDASSAVSGAIKGTGLSMVYTNVILFFGFSIFAASSFGGTVALGILISVTLLVSLITNLLLLPSILLSLEKRLMTKALTKEPLIEIFDEEEDIDLDKLEIEKTEKIIGSENI
ncbi:MAG: MMPL family transporter [Bacteroidota bacterium]